MIQPTAHRMPPALITERGPKRGPILSANQPLSGVAQVSRATNIVNATWMPAAPQLGWACCIGSTKTDQPYCRLAIMTMQKTLSQRFFHRSLLGFTATAGAAGVLITVELIR